MSEAGNEALSAHRDRASKKEEAYKNFIANSKLHIWALNDGAKFFVRCVNEDTTYQLVAVWALSTVDGSTKIYTKEAHREGVLLVLEITGGGAQGAAGENQLVDPDCYDAFLCSAGDEVLEDFDCPSLDTASPVE